MDSQQIENLLYDSDALSSSLSEFDDSDEDQIGKLIMVKTMKTIWLTVILTRMMMLKVSGTIILIYQI
jgi:hypothetical protein